MASEFPGAVIPAAKTVAAGSVINDISASSFILHPPMARHRLHAELVKLLEWASQPLYVLDDALAIIYLNEACRNWLGPDAEELLGRKCVYHSGNELTGLDATAAGLCPPPAVLEGREVSADVAKLSAQEQDGGLKPTLPTLFRRARFVPLLPAR